MRETLFWASIANQVEAPPSFVGEHWSENRRSVGPLDPYYSNSGGPHHSLQQHTLLLYLAVLWCGLKSDLDPCYADHAPIPQISMSDNISDTGIGGDTLLIWKGPLRSWSVEVLRSEVFVAQMRCHSSLWLSTYLGLFSDKGNICLCHRLQESMTRSLQFWYWHN